MSRYTESQGRWSRSGIADQCADYLLAGAIAVVLLLLALSWFDVLVP